MERENEWNQMKDEYLSKKMSEPDVNLIKQSIQKAKKNQRGYRIKGIVLKHGAVVLAATAVFMLLPNLNAGVAYAMEQIPGLGNMVRVVTFRDYQYENARNHADVNVPELVCTTEEGNEETTGQMNGSESADMAGVLEVTEENQDQLLLTTSEINSEIETLTDKYVKEFEDSLANEDGYQDLYISHEVIATTENYFTLQLIVYQGAGSGYEQHFFYTIDLNSGERMTLADLFVNDADYVSAISNNIRGQMRQQKKEEGIPYWIDDTDVPEWNFTSIAEDQTFYINADNDLVICFNEGDVAPMYVGCVEFVITPSAIASIRR